MGPLASTEDIEARHGDLTEEQGARVQALLTDASALIRSEVPESTAAWVTDGGVGSGDEEVPAEVVAIAVAVVYRAWRNPDAIASESLGEHAVTYRSTGSDDALWLTKQEVRRIKRAAGLSTFRAATLQTPYSGESDGTSISDPENDLSL